MLSKEMRFLQTELERLQGVVETNLKQLTLAQSKALRAAQQVEEAATDVERKKAALATHVTDVLEGI
jgi:hypothetical protein